MAEIMYVSEPKYFLIVLLLLKERGYVFVSVSLPVCLSVCMSVCLSVCLVIYVK